MTFGLQFLPYLGISSVHDGHGHALHVLDRERRPRGRRVPPRARRGDLGGQVWPEAIQRASLRGRCRKGDCLCFL